MPLRKDPSGRWRAELKRGREYVKGKTFDTKREAESWLARERAALSHGLDPKAGAVTLKHAFAVYLEDRRHVVAMTTWKAYAEFGRLIPPSLGNLHVSAISDREVQRALDIWSRTYAEGSVRHHRAVLSGFFGWAVRERLRPDNPVSRTKVARQRKPRQGMLPFTESELDEVRSVVSRLNQRAGDVIWLLGWTGLRWSEARELRVGDVAREPIPRIIVSRSAPEHGETKATKSGRTRHIPIPDHVMPLIEELMDGKAPDDLLVTTTSEGRLHSAAFKRTTAWSTTGRGRRIHDLRHTAACLWLANGVPISTVQSWLGHSSLQTTQIYVHYLGDVADRAGLDVLNRRGRAGGAGPPELSL